MHFECDARRLLTMAARTVHFEWLVSVLNRCRLMPLMYGQHFRVLECFRRREDDT